ncbi:MAG: hypothetical protein Q9166_000388 [cf. Caloplaca sp. 2 TL-2023]
MPKGVIDLTILSSPPKEAQPSTQFDLSLQVAIDTAEPHRLRQALMQICTGSKDATQLAQDILLVPVNRKKPAAEDKDGDKDDEDDEDDTDESESESSSDEQAAAAELAVNKLHGLKRMRPRIIRETAPITLDAEETEPDYDGDAWADHDENCHGTIDSEEMRQVYPEKFIYTCCDGDGTSEGCKTSRHVEKISKRMCY